jgi:hypothetical protein
MLDRAKDMRAALKKVEHHSQIDEILNSKFGPSVILKENPS